MLKNFLAESFQEGVDLISIKTKLIPVENENSMRIVNRYHEAVWHAFRIMQKECPDISPEASLQMAFESVTDSVGLNGISPTLAIYALFHALNLPATSNP